ncbi:PhzF family phenazine biosynthesis isomerase [Domibacillus sp. A3M-37]|uniref:PhzF family phenazine biosynthesis protein n=1 Tax=Domibacillus sp. A3M-37 TaxID=2962037 RepID=UPI0020B86702|nr:PhzF family phenazine biosynthesis isomerase [Domibacillus sp. A3M-37]MCP3763843.1 PhzF family phenazine biosynthesis isomerase [Domibacillus sp. A3M-37]
MGKIDVFHYDAFTTSPGKGNPAGIVLGGQDLTEENMQKIAAEVGFNECAFPIPSDAADIRIRYFTPGHEMPLCGHATMASMAALLKQKKLPEKEMYTIETAAGILSVHVTKEKQHYQIRMEHAKPEFVLFHGSKEKLAASIGIETGDIDPAYPIAYGSTGTWTLCIPISNVAAFHKMKPDNSQFPGILQEMPKASVHPFSLTAVAPDADMHARHFSSPYSGTLEDAVTGTGSGVMGAYYATYVEPGKKENYSVIVEQGQEMGKDGRVLVQIQNELDLQIAISGTAVFVQLLTIEV